MSLLTINWLVVRFLYSSPRANRIVGGTERILVRNGVIDQKALQDELLSEEELLASIHKQGFDGMEGIKECVLAPNGSFYIEGQKPTQTETDYAALIGKLEQIQRELQQIQKQLPAA